MEKTVLRIGGMSCSACSSGLEKYLNKQNGIISASVNLVMASATIEYDGSILSYGSISDFISEAGFECIGEYDKTEDNDTSLSKKQFAVFSVLYDADVIGAERTDAYRIDFWRIHMLLRFCYQDYCYTLWIYRAIGRISFTLE